MKKRYYEALKQNRTCEPVTKLEHGLRGRPLKLGDLDSNIQDYIRKLHLSGGVVNRAIVIHVAATTGIVEYRIVVRAWRHNAIG